MAKYIRRTGIDRSQSLRRAVQLAFFALNAWIAVEFYLFVRYYETGGKSMWAARPAGVEGWLPIASLMNLKVLLLTGQMPRLHPAGMFLLIAFLAASWLFRKSFCGWLCPVGTISEYLWKLGRQTFGRNFRLPRKLDVGLRSLKYLLLALFLYAVGSMTVPGILAFLEGPYGIVDDVKMLNFFRFMGLAGGTVVAGLVVGSVFVQNSWCRYLCPYGALM
ncbi:MAG TPA: 4Fe-4S binding protein, partial [Candidatus Solibacter sp.]